MIIIGPLPLCIERNPQTRELLRHLRRRRAAVAGSRRHCGIGREACADTGFEPRIDGVQVVLGCFLQTDAAVLAALDQRARRRRTG